MNAVTDTYSKPQTDGGFKVRIGKSTQPNIEYLSLHKYLIRIVHTPYIYIAESK